MTKFTPEAVMTALEEIVEGHEDYVYESPRFISDSYGEDLPDGECYYATPTGEPSCLVGHVVNKLDPELFTVLLAEENKNSVFPVNEIPGFCNVPEFPRTALKIMQAAQNVQDKGAPWREALAAAKAVADASN